jgi:hypothetical protein
MTRLLQTRDAFEQLVERLAHCPAIASYGSEEPETLAHAFSDIEESMRKFLENQLPKLVDPSVKGKNLEDLLFDIREEFRHILYHLHDPAFFRVLEPTHEWLTVSSNIE